MKSWSPAFLIIAILAALLGFAGISGMIANIAKILFVTFLLLFTVSLFCNRKNAWPKNNNKGKS
jgi:uncharacterized membrane protein YtjA (UPF0391 family)